MAPFNYWAKSDRHPLQQFSKQLAPVKMTRSCRTCKKNIPNCDQTFNCVACNCHLHLDPAWTGLWPEAFNGIEELGQIAMLLCTACVNNNERDAFIRNRTVMQVNDEIDQLNVTAKMENTEAKVTDLVEEKINEAMRKTRTSGRKLCQRSE